MRTVHYFHISALAIGVSACSTHPLPRDVTGLSTPAIVAKIRCEASAAIAAHIGDYSIPKQRYTKRMKDYRAGGIGYDFTFTITENNGIGVDTAFLHPFTSGLGKFSLNAGLGHDRQRQSERKFIVVESFEELTKAKTCDRHLDRENWIYPITGTIGLEEVVKTYLELDEPTTTVLSSFSDQLAFTTTISGSVKPKIQLNSLPGEFRLTEASGSFGADRKDVHKVRIVLATDKTPDIRSRDDERERKRDTRPMLQRQPDVKDRIREELLRQRELQLKIIPD